MFRITFFVEDKNLGEAFKRLAGLAKNVEHAYVPNVEPKANGKLRATAADGMDMFMKEMSKRKLTEVDANTARTIVAHMGFSPTSYSYVLQGLVRTGALSKRKAGKGNNKVIYSKEAK